MTIPTIWMTLNSFNNSTLAAARGITRTLNRKKEKIISKLQILMLPLHHKIFRELVELASII